MEQLEPRLCLGGLTSADTGGWAASEGDDLLVPAIGTESESHWSAGQSDEEADTDFVGASDTDSTASSTGSAHATGSGPMSPSAGSDDSIMEPVLDAALHSESQAAAAASSQVVVSGPGPEWTAVAETGSEASGTVALNHLQAGQNALTGPTEISTPNDQETAGEPGIGTDTLQTTSAAAARPSSTPWWETVNETVTIRYDFRDQGGFENQITDAQIAEAESAMTAWSQATGGKLVFQRDTTADASEIVNIGTGDLAALGFASGKGDALGLGGGVTARIDEPAADGSGAGTSRIVVTGVAWMDFAETWDTTQGNGNPTETVDFFTVTAHELGHVLGVADSEHMTAAEAIASGTANGLYVSGNGIVAHDIMFGYYDSERAADSIAAALRNARFEHGIVEGPVDLSTLEVHAIVLQDVQLTAPEVTQLLERASRATASEDAIIAVTDRLGRILGVRVEQAVLNRVAQEPTQAEANRLLAFMIDGAVAKARTTSFFANGDIDNQTLGPLTTRTVRFLSQSTITQREVESNPNDYDSPTTRGPGFVAPIGLGGHFPPEVPFTPPVDLFGIEHINRDSIVDPGPNNLREFTFDAAGNIVLLPGSDDRILPNRLNIPDDHIAPGAEGSLVAPESFGFVSGIAPNQQARGVSTLPGGIPIYRDTNLDGIGETLIGGIGVFFPGPEGYATFEQNFIPGVGQSTLARLNAPKVLEAEYIAYAAVGGSLAAQIQGFEDAVIGDINGVAKIPTIDLPLGRIDLVGITLEFVGPVAGPEGVKRLVEFGQLLGVGNSSGADQPVDFGADGIPLNGDESLALAGRAPFEGFIVPPQDGVGITAEEVRQIIEQGIAGARLVRSAVRLDTVTLEPGSRTRMVLAVADLQGNIVGLYRMKDALTDAIDAVPAKARNVSYFADPARLQAVDQIPFIPAGVAFTGRTFRFTSEPRYPSGIDGTLPPQFSSLLAPGINPVTAENLGAPLPFDVYTQPTSPAYIFDAFLPNTNFREPDSPNQNGVAWFPGSSPVYRPGTGELIGGFGVSGDGVDQNDLVTAFGAFGFLPNQVGVPRADEFRYREVRLPYLKYLRNPFG